MRGKREPLDAKGQRVYARLAADVARELAGALAAESQFGTITRAELARRLGRDKAFVTRKLSGGENMELRTVAAFLAALGYEMDVAARRINAPPRVGRNFFHETGAQMTTNGPRGITQTLTIKDESIRQNLLTPTTSPSVVQLRTRHENAA
jgi:hypothetical protein